MHLFFFVVLFFQEGNTVLLLALKWGHDNVAVQLMEHGADIGSKNKVVQLVMCMSRPAAEAQYACDVVPPCSVSNFRGAHRFLLLVHVWFCDPLAQAGKTTLHYAAMNNCRESLRMLLEKGAEVNACDEVSTRSYMCQQ